MRYRHISWVTSGISSVTVDDELHSLLLLLLLLLWLLLFCGCWCRCFAMSVVGDQPRDLILATARNTQILAFVHFKVLSY